MNNDTLDLVNNEPGPPVQVNSFEATSKGTEFTLYIGTAASPPSCPPVPPLMVRTDSGSKSMDTATTGTSVTT